MGRARTSALAPLLRSEAMARVLASVVLSSEPGHLKELAERSQVSYSVAQREVDRLEDAGLVTSTRFGPTRVVRPVESHPLYPELRSLLLKTYGPREVLAELLAGEEGIREAHLYGSWARRYFGEWGPPPKDLDVVVVGQPTLERMEEVEVEAEHRLGQPVQIQVVPDADWQSQSSGFVRTVRSRPLVSLAGEAP